MKRTCFVYLLFISLCTLSRFGTCINVDGTIASNEYGTNAKLPKSINSEWYVYANATFLCVGVQMTGLQHVLVALTFNPNKDTENQPATASKRWAGTVDFDVAATHFVWCQSNSDCAITNSFGDPTVGSIVSERSTTVLEFCMDLSVVTLQSRVAYFQGKVTDDSTNTVAESPDTYFYGFYLDERIPTGLDANWFSFPFITTSGGDWDNGVSWLPMKPYDSSDDNTDASPHAILLHNVTVNSEIQISHLTQLNEASLTLNATGFVVGDYTRTSYWSYDDSDSFIAASYIVIELWAPITLISFTNSSINFPEIDIRSQTDNQLVKVPGGYTAEAMTLYHRVNVTRSPSSLKTLSYSSDYFTIGKEYPTDMTSPLTLAVEDGATVYANSPASYTSYISTVILEDHSSFFYGLLNANIDSLPSLYITSELDMSDDSTFTISAFLHVTSLSTENIICMISTTELVHVQNDTVDENWPFLVFDESEYPIDVLEISENTTVILLNTGLLGITWESSASSDQLCNETRCLIPAQDATITVSAVEYSSSCKTSKSFTVKVAKPASKSHALDTNQTIIAAVVSIAGAILIAAVVFVIIKRRKSHNKSNQDVEMSYKKTYEESVVMPKTADSQSVIDPKYEIPYKEITFGPELGRGAFGIVYKCRWRNTDTVVKQTDINKSDKSSIELFLKEAANVLKLRTHPNVCTVFGVCTDPRYPICILMEYLPDGSLDNLIYENKIKLDVKTVLELARDIASGMGHLHAENVLHCDLACRNLLVTSVKDKHVVKIADFGLSRITEKDTYNASNSATFPIRWTAPETLRSGKISRASDIWSYGVVLWEIIEGKRPYTELSNTEVTKAVCDKGHRLPRPDRIQIPNELWQLMQQCWAEVPTERPTFDAIYRKLEAIGAEFWGPPKQQVEIYRQSIHETAYNSSYATNENKYAKTSGALYGNTYNKF